MKALVVDENGKLEVRNIQKPTINKCQAIVKLKSCGICNGTDMKLIHKTFKNFDTYPAVIGHEGVGEVVEVGEQVTKYKVGDIVLLPFLEENIGEIYPGWGAYSEYAIVGDIDAYIKNGMGPGTPDFSEAFYAQTIIKKEDKVDPISAAMVITFREVLSAIKRFGFKPNESILIFGAGPVGLCFTKFAKLLGMKTVIIVDILDEKIKVAKQMGADIVFNSTKDDIESEVKKLFPEGIDYVVDAVGINQLINQAMGMIKYNGKICCYGISANLGMDLDWSHAPYNWSVDFIQWPLKKEEAEAHEQIMAWINLGVLNPYDFISDIIEFDNIIDAFELVNKKLSSTKKIIIKF